MEQILHQFTLSPKFVSENIKWNLNQKTKKIFSLIINTKNANSFTGEQGYKSMQNIADTVSKQLTDKQKEDEDNPKIIKIKKYNFWMYRSNWRKVSSRKN